MTEAGRPAARPGWSRDAQVPRALADLHGPTTGEIALPVTLFWSGPRPGEVRWDVADRARRRDLYEIVLVEGSLDDIERLVDGPSLLDVWDQMYLPPHVRAAWAALIDDARAAA